MISDNGQQATEFIEKSNIKWHQKFELAKGVITPGVNDIEELFSLCKVPQDLTGMTVLDIGTTNGASAFISEARGAKRVVAVDIYAEDRFGFDKIKEFLDSEVEFVQGNLYTLPVMFPEGFDIVFCWGVLYHLRHPVLALDCLRLLTKKLCTIETAICDMEIDGNLSALKFYRKDDFAGDSSNWFSPTTFCMQEMLYSSGFEIESLVIRPNDMIRYRGLFDVRPSPGSPEFQDLSYEVPLLIPETPPVTWYPEEHGGVF
jgi:tRNA (mo5U34)-methyltransferase